VQGVGLGLRPPHFQAIQAQKPDIPWFEVLIDNYLHSGGIPLRNLEKIRNDYPITFHGVDMSLGSSDPLNFDYLRKLKMLQTRLEPTWISDHLCWSSVGKNPLHDLLPLPYHEEIIDPIAARIQQVQDFLGERILVENVSTYGTFKASEMNEWEFLTCVVERADCYILLDINNIYVNAFNHSFAPREYLAKLPMERVKEIHLAGYTDYGDHLLDTHGSQVSEPVWQLYRETIERHGVIPTLIEWDNDIPSFDTLRAEALRAAQEIQNVCN